MENAIGKRAEHVKIEVAADEEFHKILFEKKGKNLKCTGVSLEVDIQPRTIYYVRVNVLDETGDKGCGITTFETGKKQEPWKAHWIGPESGDTFHPVLRKCIRTEKQVIKARLYICGLGVYEAYMNGKKIGEEYLHHC